MHYAVVYEAGIMLSGESSEPKVVTNSTFEDNAEPVSGVIGVRVRKPSAKAAESNALAHKRSRVASKPENMPPSSRRGPEATKEDALLNEYLKPAREVGASRARRLIYSKPNCY